jgi:hypothetical protein
MLQAKALAALITKNEGVLGHSLPCIRAELLVAKSAFFIAFSFLELPI